MKVLVCKCTKWLRHVSRSEMPAYFVLYSHGMRLFFNTSFNISLGKTNLRPSIMLRYVWSRIRIALRYHLCGSIYLNSCHYSISFTCVSIKSISSSESPYFRYSCKSISCTDLDQSMSELEEKS